MTSEFTPTPGWLAAETEQLRPQIAKIQAQLQRAAALDAIHVDGCGDL
jgi:hypothetical protein